MGRRGGGGEESDEDSQGDWRYGRDLEHEGKDDEERADDELHDQEEAHKEGKECIFGYALRHDCHRTPAEISDRALIASVTVTTL